MAIIQPMATIVHETVGYLWKSVAAANAFYTPDWVAMVTTRWAGPPQRQEWETPMVVESAERRLVAAE